MLFSQLIPNRLLLYGIHLLALGSSSIPASVREAHRTHNVTALSATTLFDDATQIPFIENQPRWQNIRFGSHPKSNMAYSGCGIIATWNALCALEKEPSTLADVIRAEKQAVSVQPNAPRTREQSSSEWVDAFCTLIECFEEKGQVWGGGFGTDPIAIYQFFRSRYSDIEVITTASQSKLNAFGGRHRCFIATIYNNAANLFAGLHTVCVTRDASGFKVHNGGQSANLGDRQTHPSGQTDKRGGYTPASPTLAQALFHIAAHSRPIIIIGINTNI